MQCKKQFWRPQVVNTSSCSSAVERVRFFLRGAKEPFDSNWIPSGSPSLLRNYPLRLHLGDSQMTGTLCFFRAIQSSRIRRGAQPSIFLVCNHRTRDNHVSIYPTPQTGTSFPTALWSPWLPFWSLLSSPCLVFP